VQLLMDTDVEGLIGAARTSAPASGVTPDRADLLLPETVRAAVQALPQTGAATEAGAREAARRQRRHSRCSPC
jgi:hypothetical protein